MLSKLSLTANQTLWLLPFCILLGVAISYLLYNRKAIKDDVPAIYRSLLFILRASTISLLTFFLLSPAIRSRTAQIEKPILLLGIDNSESVMHLSDSLQLATFHMDLASALKDLESEFDVHAYSFGEETRETSIDHTYNYDERLTNISQFLAEMEIRYANRNTAMMILSSDGQYNKGKNPVYATSSYQYPIFSIAQGDTSIKKDVSIEKVNHNRLAFLGNTFEAEILVKSTLLKNQKAIVQIRKEGELITDDFVVFTSDFDNKNITLTIEADKVGLHKYEVEILPFEGEASNANNLKTFYIDVLEGEQRILIIHASPHPDVKALKLAIGSSRNYKAENISLKDFNGDISEFNLIILHGVPIKGNQELVSLSGAEVPILFVLGQTTNPVSFNKMNAGFRIQNFKGLFNQTNARLNEDFLFFSAPNELREFSKYPPLIAPLADYNNNGELHSLFYQNIGNIETPFPLISFSERNDRKVGVISGEGIWRWRLYDYLKNGDNKLFDEMIQKFIQFLATKDDKSRFRVFTESTYFENMNVVIEAEYYNKSFELRNDQVIQLELQDETNKVYKFEFLSTGKKYTAELGKLKVGEYKWKASIDDGIDLFEKMGSLSIKPLQLERNSIRSDHKVLVNISEKHGGKLFYSNELIDLVKEIKSKENIKPMFHYLERYEDLISIKTLFLILLVFFATEWGIRKYFGLS